MKKLYSYVIVMVIKNEGGVEIDEREEHIVTYDELYGGNENSATDCFPLRCFAFILFDEGLSALLKQDVNAEPSLKAA